MLTPGDLLTDAMLEALDSKLAVDFGESVTGRLADVRRIAISDWLAPRLEKAGYDPSRHRMRRASDAVVGYTGGRYTDYTGVPVPLATVLATIASDALYVGQRAPFQALWLGLADHVSAVPAVASLAAWNGTTWAALTSLADGTQAVEGKPFSGGGRFSWWLPEDWPTRAVNGQTYHWLKLMTTATPTAGTMIDVVHPIVRSRLSYPASLFALSVIYRDAAATRRGAWLDQAKDYEALAREALEVVLPLVTDEFDLTGDEVAGLDDQNLTTGGPGTGLWTLERG
jgi:hypothetical protein